jgi:hypothetical protein
MTLAGIAERAPWHHRGLERVVASERGMSLVEVLLALAIAMTVGAMTVAVTATAIDDMRTAVAARYIAGRIGSARIDAVRRGTAVALRFEAEDDDYMYAPHEDGNGNGVRSAEIRTGVDRPLVAFEKLGDKFGRPLRLMPGAGRGWQADTGPGVRIGSARLLRWVRTATPGTL